MCGILGAVGPINEVDRWVDENLKSLQHRGPDDYGRYRSEAEDVVLAHRRLAVIDLTRSGHQPMQSSDMLQTLVFNGEIYNFLELRDELTSLGHSFRSSSDTEVVLTSYRQWGRRCVDRFVGMWAFALHDVRTSELWLCRDRFGIKPLYLVDSPGFIAFSSEIAPLVPLSGREVNLTVAYDYLRWGHVDRTTETFVQGVRAIGAGESLVIALGAEPVSQSERYYSAPRRTGDTTASYGEAVVELRRLLTRSVELHLRSDVPVGAALSGGLDSSALVMLMREVGGENLSLNTFSYRAMGHSYDESRWATEVARASGAASHLVTLADRDVSVLCPDVVRAQFEPFGSLSVLAQHAVFRAAAQADIKVMLDGQGADELFAGYSSFRVERFVDLIRRGHMASAWRLAAVMQRSSGPGSVARAMLRALPSDIAVLLWRKWIGRSCPSWLDVEFFDQAGISTAASSADMSESFDVALLDAQSTSSLPGLLRYEDRNSMAASVESRVPFVTADLASFAATLPASYLINREGRSKSILIDAMRGLVPDSVLDRRDKVAFSVPQRQWMAAVAQPVGQPPGVIANASEQSDVRLWSYTQFWNAMHTI